MHACMHKGETVPGYIYRDLANDVIIRWTEIILLLRSQVVYAMLQQQKKSSCLIKGVQKEVRPSKDQFHQQNLQNNMLSIHHHHHY